MKFFTGKQVSYNGATYDVDALTMAAAETTYANGGKVYKVGENLLSGNLKSIKMLASELGEIPMRWQPDC